MTTALDTRQHLDTSAFGPAYRLGDSTWHVWGVGLLRSAGFPVSGLDLLGGPRAARAAVEAGTGDTASDTFRAAYRADTDAEAERLARLATDDRVRTAIAWQNRTVYRILDSLAARKGKESKRRQRERTLAMYWLRYCAKADTIGFFGPGAWITVGRGRRALDLRHGPSLTSRSRTFFERWTVAALADWMTAQPGARWWFPPMLRPDVHLDGDRLLLPGGRTLRLREDDVAVLRLADGDRGGQAITDALVATAGWDPATAQQRVRKVLDRLLKQRVLTWDANIPVDVRAEQVLRRRVAGIGDPELFVRCETILTELDRLREEIDRAGSAEELVAALDRLDDFFVTTTGQDASREEGKAYAGRTLCYQDSLRDCALDLGGDFLDTIARPLALVADAADWFGNRLAELVETEVAALVRRAAARRPGGKVSLADVWPQVLGLFWGDKATPVHTATRELAEKWRQVLDLDPAAPASRPVRLGTADVEHRIREVFATGPVGSPHLAVHSPDLQVVAASPEAFDAGDYTVVLGELHACLATLDLPFLDWTCDSGFPAGQGQRGDRRAPARAAAAGGVETQQRPYGARADRGGGPAHRLHPGPVRRPHPRRPGDRDHAHRDRRNGHRDHPRRPELVRGRTARRARLHHRRRRVQDRARPGARPAGAPGRPGPVPGDLAAAGRRRPPCRTRPTGNGTISPYAAGWPNTPCPTGCS
ncbi:hypothetical protein GCM10020256_26010 [Streptomyces thermocoprophilus]